MARAVLATCLLLVLLWPDVARAFSLDPVLVSWLKPEDLEDAALDDEGERIRRMIEARLGQEHLVVSLDEVPPFEDYGVRIYLRGCPPLQDAGCAMMVGQRGGADWVVAGTVAREGEALAVGLSWIAVREGRVLVAIRSRLEPGYEDAFLDGVARLHARVVGMDWTQEDARGEVVTPVEAFERRRQEAAEAARDLQGLDLDIEPARAPGRLSPPRLGREEVERLAGTDAIAPWETLGMSQAQYVRYRDARVDLATWRRRAAGRQHRLLVGVWGSMGSGPFGQRYDGRIAREDGTLEVAEIDVRYGRSGGGSQAAALELSYGVLPFLDLGVGVASRRAPFQAVVHEEVADRFTQPPGQSRRSLVSLQLGAQATVAPLPAARARPTLHVGVGRWQGAPVQAAVGLPDNFPVPEVAPLWVAQAGLGGEVATSEVLALQLRASAVVPVNGHHPVLMQQGVPSLSHRAEPFDQAGMGIEVGAGFAVRTGPLLGPHRQGRSRR